MYRMKPRPTERNAICDVCGFKKKHYELKPRWDGLMVCKEDWEPRHIRDLYRVPRSERAPDWVRPESTGGESWGTVTVTDDQGNVLDVLSIVVLPDGSRIYVYFDPDADAPWILLGVDPDIDVIIVNNGDDVGGTPIDTTSSSSIEDTLFNQMVGRWDPSTAPVGQTNGAPNLVVHGAIVTAANPTTNGRSQGSYYSPYVVQTGVIRISVRVTYQDPSTGYYYTKYHPWAGQIAVASGTSGL